MSPHCDSLDGPVVTAARRALEHGDVDLVLPYVRVEGEQEVRQAFDLARKAEISSRRRARSRTGGSSRRSCVCTGLVKELPSQALSPPGSMWAQ
jgi:hypothetical protein